MLRPFQLTSGPITYANDIAEVQFPTRSRGTARSAIVGMSHNVSGDNAGVIVSTAGWGTTIERMTIGGRNYIQGDGIAMPLISKGNGIVFGADTFYNRFVGSSIRLPSALGSGQQASGMAYGPREDIRLRLVRLTDDSFVNRVTLWGVQWDDDGPSIPEWNRLRFEGIGETYFAGGFIPFYPAAGLQILSDELPQPPSAIVLRRTGFRGVLTDNTDGTPAFPAGIPASPTENNLVVQFSSSQDRSPQNQPVPFRNAMGFNGEENPIGMLDMERGERSLATVLAVGTSAQDNNVRTHILHMFEGRDPNVPAVLSSNAVS